MRRVRRVYNPPLEKLDNLNGVKLRTPPLKMYRMTWEYLGASPTPMGVAELFTSMQSGAVDGQENPLQVLEWMARRRAMWHDRRAVPDRRCSRR